MWLSDTVEKMMLVTGRNPYPAKLVQTPRRRMLKMAALFDLDESTLFSDLQSAQEAVQTCDSCSCAQACERFQRQQGATFVPAVCPNGELFKKLAA